MDGDITLINPFIYTLFILAVYSLFGNSNCLNATEYSLFNLLSVNKVYHSIIFVIYWTNDNTMIFICFQRDAYKK